VKVILGIVVAVLAIILSAPTTSVNIEYIPPYLTQAECLTWDEAKDKYDIEGDVLIEYMLVGCD